MCRRCLAPWLGSARGVSPFVASAAPDSAFEVVVMLMAPVSGPAASLLHVLYPIEGRSVYRWLMSPGYSSSRYVT